jgi:hypothetical protein
MESEMSEPACATTLDVALPDEPGDGEEPEEPADTTLLAAPQNLRAVIRQDVPGYSYKYEITMMWDAVEGAKGYDVFVNTADTSGFQMGYTNGTAYVAGSNEEITFEFYVVAFNDSIDSKPSEVYTVTVGDEPVDPENPGGDEPNDPENPGGDEPDDPENPGGDEPADPETPVDPEDPTDPETPADSVVLAAPVVVVDTVTATTVTLAWNVVENATSYNVYMDSALVASVAGTTYTVDSLTAETTYSFTVTAVADTLESVASNVVTVTTLAAEQPEEPGTGIVENAAAFSIYPNPAVDRVVIATESTIESVSIYTLTGVMIYSEVETNNTINVSDLNSGVYFIKVVTSEGESVQRFIKK